MQMNIRFSSVSHDFCKWEQFAQQFPRQSIASPIKAFNPKGFTLLYENTKESCGPLKANQFIVVKGFLGLEPTLSDAVK